MSNENGNGNHRNGNSPNGHVTSNGHQRNGHVPANGVAKNGNGHHGADAIPAHDLLWDSLPASVTDKLAQPLDASLVSQRKGRGNRNVSYLEGRTVIDQANRIFGHGGWGHEVVGDVTLRDLDQVNTQTGEVRHIRAYSATVKVTVPGAPHRTDVGFQPVADETVEGHETAFKGAVTDALKRALRTFGAQFGNSLYGDVAGQPGGGAGDTLAPALRKTLLDLGVSQGFDEDGSGRRCGARRGRTWTNCPPRSSRPLLSGPPARCSSGRTPRARPELPKSSRATAPFTPRHGAVSKAGWPRFLFTGPHTARRKRHDRNQDAHPLGLSPGHRGAGRGHLARLHRQPRRVEAQPGAVG